MFTLEAAMLEGDATCEREFKMLIKMLVRSAQREAKSLGESVGDAFLERILFLSWQDSYSRMAFIVEDVYPLLKNSQEWFAVLGFNWTACDNISAFTPDIKKHISTYLRGKKTCLIPTMMTPAEIRRVASLPDEMDIYRGCYTVNQDGLSWSLDAAQARRFPFYNRYRMPGQPLLVHARVRREDIVALKDDRGESEIITHKARGVEVLNLEEPADVALASGT